MSAPLNDDTYAIDAMYHHDNAWVAGRFEFHRVEPGLLRFEFQATDPRQLPPGPVVKRRGVIEGISNTEDIDQTGARSFHPPPGHGMLFVIPRERPTSTANPKKLPFAVKDPEAVCQKLQELRVEG